VLIEHILIDFDGVLRHWPRSYTPIEAKYDLPAHSIVTAAFAEKLLTPAIRGTISDDEWRRRIEECLLRKYPKSQARKAIIEWSVEIGDIDGHLLGWLRSFDNATLSLVTNATSRLDADLSTHGIAHSFDHIFNSSEIGFIKPEPQYYSYVLNNLGVRACDTVYIDDSVENVEAARQLGVHSHHYVGIDPLRDFLTSFT